MRTRTFAILLVVLVVMALVVLPAVAGAATSCPAPDRRYPDDGSGYVCPPQPKLPPIPKPLPLSWSRR